MKKLEEILLFLFVVVGIASLSVLAAQLATNYQPTTTPPKRVIGRYDAYEPFYILDGDMTGLQGQVLKDRQTGDCVLYTWMPNGTHSVAGITCGGE